MADTSFTDSSSTAQGTLILSAWLNAIGKLAFWGRRPNFATTTGTGNAQVLTLETGSLYTAGTEADGDEFWFKAGATNTGATTLQVLPSGGSNVARAVQFGGVALAGGEIQSGSLCKVQRLGTTWQLAVSKQVVFTGPTAQRTYTLPDASSALLTDTGTATLTNKTLDSTGTGNVLTVRANALAGSTQGFSLINGTLVPSQNGTVLTVAIKTLAGADPSAADPVYVLFRNATAGTGDYTVITLTAATSIATTVGGTFGVGNSTAFKLWVVGFNDGGTFRLGFINCLTTAAGAGAGRDVTAIYPLGQFPIASSTQIGAGSTAAGTFYTAGAAVSSKAYAVLGYLTYESGLATAGTFGVNQSRTHLQNRSDPLPGQILQTPRNDSGAVATGTTAIPFDNTIPQSTEGDQYLSQAITPSSGANVLNISAVLFLSYANADRLMSALFQDSTANALAVSSVYQSQSTAETLSVLNKKILAAGTAATTFKVRSGGTTGGAGVTFNGQTAGRIFGGAYNSYIETQEVMA